jgi:hypothetical protein
MRLPIPIPAQWQHIHYLKKWYCKVTKYSHSKGKLWLHKPYIIQVLRGTYTQDSDVTPENLHHSSFIFVMHNPVNFTNQTGTKDTNIFATATVLRNNTRIMRKFFEWSIHFSESKRLLSTCSTASHLPTLNIFSRNSYRQITTTHLLIHIIQHTSALELIAI